MQPIIITGGPGAGKTTLVNALAEQGYETFEEVSRALIEEQSRLEEGILPWHDLEAFADLCLIAMSEQKHHASKLNGKITFLDRAIPDICGYLQQAKLTVAPKYHTGCRGYFPQALFCEPEASIYVQDDIRPYPFEEALSIHRALVSVYRQHGFDVVEVPWGSVEERVCFVKRWLAGRLL